MPPSTTFLLDGSEGVGRQQPAQGVAGERSATRARSPRHGTAVVIETVGTEGSAYTLLAVERAGQRRGGALCQGVSATHCHRGTEGGFVTTGAWTTQRVGASMVGALLALPAQGRAQSGADTAHALRVFPVGEQVAAAVAPAPKALRATATVWGYAPEGHFTRLRDGNGDMVCLASDPHTVRFHVACYHRSLEPFMARGRSLRASGVTGDRVDSVRFAEIRGGKLRMPRHAAALYSLTGPAGSFDPTTGAVTGARHLYVVYMPFGTAASTGISAEPVEGAPWIMFPGTPKAHLMFVPKM